jgi:hypothetical protein
LSGDDNAAQVPPLKRLHQTPRLAILQLQRHPTRSHVQQSNTCVVNFQRISTTEVSGNSSRRVDKEESRRRPNPRAHLAARQSSTEVSTKEGENAIVKTVRRKEVPE